MSESSGLTPREGLNVELGDVHLELRQDAIYEGIGPLKPILETQREELSEGEAHRTFGALPGDTWIVHLKGCYRTRGPVFSKRPEALDAARIFGTLGRNTGIVFLRLL
jgi:hypothetical protein